MTQENKFPKELMECYGWTEVVSRNPVMYSYVNDGMRMNHYFTTGTVTIQHENGTRGSWRDITEDTIEDIICNPNPLLVKTKL